MANHIVYRSHPISPLDRVDCERLAIDIYLLYAREQGFAL